MRKAILIGLMSFGVHGVFSQSINFRTLNYSKADSIALNIAKIKYKSYSELAGLLTVGLNTEQEKFRVIYRWIAENIKYSYSKTDDASKVLKAKRAACIGYATLLKDMCEAVNLKCEVVEGWSKIEQKEIGQKMKVPTHAWNAISLGGKWYLTDITWASSYYEPISKKFIRYFDTSYFLPSPQTFIKQHYPREKKWQLLDTIAGKREFRTNYVWYKGLQKYGVAIVDPAKGKRSQKATRPWEIVFKFKTPVSHIDSVSKFNLIVDETQNQPDIMFTYALNSKGGVAVRCKFPDNLKGEHEITVFYKGEQIAGYMMKFY